MRAIGACLAARWALAICLAAALLMPIGFLSKSFATEDKPGAIPFVPLHVYYLSPDGNDRNSGTSPSQAWATPRHDVNCGDVIVAEAGSYTAKNDAFGGNHWGLVSNCPSKSGGIDGKGGVYFAVVLCAGPNLSSCSVDGGPYEAFRVDRSHWAVEGFTTTQKENAGTGCMTATSETDDVIGFVAFINNIASTCSLQGFATYGWTAHGGVDQTAVVGSIAYNAAVSIGGRLCASGISMIPANGTAPTPGTHIFVAGNFGYRNINAPVGAGCNTDGEGLVFDSWSCSGGKNAPYAHQGVAEQNVWWGNGSAGLEIFPNCQAKKGDKAKVYAFNNTSYGNGQDPAHADETADLILLGLAPTAANGAYYSVTRNIFQATLPTCGNNGSCAVHGAFVSLDNTNTSLVNVSDNYIFHSNPGTRTTPGVPNTRVLVNQSNRLANLFNRIFDGDSDFPFGTNIYQDPGFADPAGLPKEAPNCSAFTNTTACMNEGYKIAEKLKPKNAVGYGYQAPGECAPDPFYPFWLKGIVHLQWDGAKLTQHSGLITKPCDM